MPTEHVPHLRDVVRKLPFEVTALAGVMDTRLKVNVIDWVDYLQLRCDGCDEVAARRREKVLHAAQQQAQHVCRECLSCLKAAHFVFKAPRSVSSHQKPSSSSRLSNRRCKSADFQRLD